MPNKNFALFDIKFGAGVWKSDMSTKNFTAQPSLGNYVIIVIFVFARIFLSKLSQLFYAFLTLTTTITN